MSPTATGTAIADTGADVYSTWQGLCPLYHAPEAEQLYDATLAVRTLSASTCEDIRTAAAALLRYSDDVRDIQARLTVLQGRAAEFEADMRLAEDPGSEQVYVDRNNELVSAVNAAVAKVARSRAARKEAMRAFGIPNVARPVEVRRTIAGYQYVFEVPAPGGGQRFVAVTDQTTDRVAGHGPHWEVGEIKKDRNLDELIDPLGRYRVMGEGKVKVDY